MREARNTVRLADDHILTIGSHQVHLTPTEARALKYLLDRPGEVVLRTVLEVEVWGFSAATRSEAVPVALRGLRNKLGPHAGRLETVRGLGWRLWVDPTPSPRLPAFATPFHGRTSDLEALDALFEGGWRIVTIVGLQGVGKTRLAAEFAGSRAGVVWVSARGADSAAEVVRRVQSAAGLVEGGTAEVDASLSESGRWIVVDEAEGAPDSVAEVLDDLPTVRVLVTSQRELGVAGEALHQLDGFGTDEGSAFLEHRMAGSRWAGTVDPGTVRTAVALLDGLPLALEFAASTPFGLGALVEELQAGRMPLAAEGTPWSSILRRSVESLPEPLLQTLLSLCASQTAWDERDLADWLGIAAVDAVRDLARRSLVTPTPEGWAVLGLLRALLSEHPNLLEQREALSAWLVARTAELDAVLFSDPTTSLVGWKRTLDLSLRGIAWVELEAVEPLVARVCRYLDLVGPVGARAQALLAAQRRLPNSLLLRVLAFDGTDLSALATAESSVVPELRLAALGMRMRVLPATVDSLLAAQVEETLQGADRLRARVHRLTAAVRDSPDVALADLESLIEDARPYPTVRAGALAGLGIGLFRIKDYGRAEAVLNLAATESGATGLRIQELFTRRVREIVRVHNVPFPSGRGMLEVASELSAAGMVRQAVEARTHAALIAFAHGHWEDARHALHLARSAAVPGSPSIEVMARWIAVALRTLDGDAEARQQLVRCDAGEFRDAGEIESFSVYFAAYLRRFADGDRSAMAADPELQPGPDADPHSDLLWMGLRRGDQPAR